MRRRDNRDLGMLFLNKAIKDAVVVRELMGNERVADEIPLFHAQQAAEKAIKAVLASRGIAFRFTHDLDELLGILMDNEIRFPDELNSVESLTPYATNLRYEDPVDEATVSRSEALRLAGGVVEWARAAIAEVSDGC